MTGRFKIGLAVALATFIIGVVAASLWIIHNQHPTEQSPLVPTIAVQQMPSHPDGWKKIAVDEKFSFYLPPDLKQE